MARRSPSVRIAGILAALVVLTTACSPSSGVTTTTDGVATTTTTAVTTTTAPVTTTATPTTATTTTSIDPLAGLATTVCAQFEAAPFPDRQAILDERARDGATTADDLLRSMKAACAGTATAYDDLENITSLAARLRDDNDQFLLNDFVLGCDTSLTGTITNGYSFNVGVVAALFRGTADGGLDATATEVFALLEPGETVSIDRELGSSPDLQCGMSARAFVAPASVATDTWDPTATGRALPDTSGEDWLSIMKSLIATEEATTDQGLNHEFGMTEDVRSAEYPRLIAGTEATETGPPTEVTEICDATELTTDLVDLAYVATSDGTTYTASGLFRRSPQDGRWRWLQRSFYLGEGNACAAVNGVFLQLGGQQA
ncbi:MAG: hypothetical protein WBV06_01485 [Acidimicrobiia bacterium]